MYLGFYDRLATTREQSDPWLECVAGLAILCAADIVVRNKRGLTDAYEHARLQVNSVRRTNLRRLLKSVVAALDPAVTDFRDERRFIIAARLLSYGIWLHAEGEYAMAVDTFGAASAAGLGDADTTMQATYHRAYALREMQRFDEAHRTYSHLINMATHHRDHRMRLEGELGLAKLASNRGNYPAAIVLVGRVIDEAIANNVPVMARKGYVQRAMYAGRSGDFIALLRDSHLALDGMTEVIDIEIAYANIANALRLLGFASDAIVALEYIMRTGQMHETRIGAALTRYEVAIDLRDWKASEALRKAIGDETLTPKQAAEFYEISSREYRTRGHFTAALSVLARMLGVAEAHGLSEAVIRADKAIEEARAGLFVDSFEPKPPQTEEDFATVTAIASAVTALCAV